MAAKEVKRKRTDVVMAMDWETSKIERSRLDKIRGINKRKFRIYQKAVELRFRQLEKAVKLIDPEYVSTRSSFYYSR